MSSRPDGGDEFLILPEGAEDAAVAVAQRVHVTVSIGVGQAADAAPDPLTAADVALMSTKCNGRNQIVIAR